MSKKHLIIGAGSAGLSAAEEIRRLNPDDEIKLVAAEDYPPYSPTVLPYFLAGRTDEARLSMRKNSYFSSIKATFVRGKNIARVLPNIENMEIKYTRCSL